MKSSTNPCCARQCVSNEKTGWGNTPAGKMIYNGKTYYARAYAKRNSLTCGG